jgi:2-polyprenyl-3-methyl-5-hydroxy-6-metoxy-1,4-benzoquinol methylase
MHSVLGPAFTPKAYARRVTDRTPEDWEALARAEPYFAVLANGSDAGVGASKTATDEFFETGEADVAALLQATASVLGRGVPLTSVLDFGCGAGRLTIPLARRAVRVVACDVAPTMLLHARRNAATAALQNVTYLLAAEALRLPPGSFDFVVSLLVLQYVPPADGYALIRSLTRLLTPGGVAALHVIAYDERRVQRAIAQAGGVLVTRLPLGPGEVLVIERERPS